METLEYSMPVAADNAATRGSRRSRAARSNQARSARRSPFAGLYDMSVLLL